MDFIWIEYIPWVYASIQGAITIVVSIIGAKYVRNEFLLQRHTVKQQTEQEINMHLTSQQQPENIFEIKAEGSQINLSSHNPEVCILLLFKPVIKQWQHMDKFEIQMENPERNNERISGNEEYKDRAQNQTDYQPTITMTTAKPSNKLRDNKLTFSITNPYLSEDSEVDDWNEEEKHTKQSIYGTDSDSSDTYDNKAQQTEVEPTLKISASLNHAKLTKVKLYTLRAAKYEPHFH